MTPLIEPTSALISGADGLDDIRHITQLAGQHLLPGGLLMLEHGYDKKAMGEKYFSAQSIH